MTSDVRSEGGPDPHDVLGVPKGADRQQVIRAFHQRVRHGGHPDAGGDTETFDEIVRARDILLHRAGAAAYESDRRRPQAATAPNAKPRPTYPPPTSSPARETNKLAIVTAMLALLGPFTWPVAIVTGYLALRQIKRTGQGGGTLVPIVLFFLYILSLPVLVILSLILIP